MADRFWVGGSGAWDETNTANWSTTPGGAGGASVPTVTDDVYFGSWSGAGTVAVGGAIASIGCASLYCEFGYVGTFVNAGYGLGIYGSVIFAPTMVASNFTVVINASSGGNYLVDLAGLTVLKLLTIAGPSFYTAAGDIVSLDIISLVVNFDLAGFNMYAAYFNSAVSSAFAPTINLGSGTVYINSKNNQPFRFTGSTPRIIIADEANIVINHIATTPKNISIPSGTTLGSLTLTGLPYTVNLFTGTSTIKTLVSSAGNTIKLPAGLTTTIQNFAVTGSLAGQTTVTSYSTTPALVNYTGAGKVSSDYLTASYIQATPTNTWYIGKNSVDGGNNTGLIFDYPPSPNGGLLFGSNF